MHFVVYIGAVRVDRVLSASVDYAEVPSACWTSVVDDEYVPSRRGDVWILTLGKSLVSVSERLACIDGVAHVNWNLRAL